jgi:ATP-dependent RNA helicase RhlE
MTFKDLGLSEPLLKAIEKKGYTEPSPIQEKAIPVVLDGNDILASAQTGTGKTAGFTLPLLHLLSKRQPKGRRPIRALVLTPTRELAAQIYDNVKEYSEFIDFRTAVIFGGVSAVPQVKKLRNGVDMLVATPGRLLDLHGQRKLSLAEVEILVLDEADRMLDMGFVHDLKRILKVMPEKRQNLLFSATFNKEIKQLAQSYLTNPKIVEATPENSTVEMIKQKIYRVDKTDKANLVIKLIGDGEWQQVLIFTRTKHGANRLAKKLDKKNITAAAIHGNKSQGARTKALAGFKSGEIRVLVATDIAARGLDIPLLPHVINFDLPNVPENYVHRIGRTGRAGASGEAISLVAADEVGLVRGIERLVGEKLPTEVVEGYEPMTNPEDVEQEKNRGGGGAGRSKKPHRRRNSDNKSGGNNHFRGKKKKKKPNSGGGGNSRGNSGGNRNSDRRF